MNTPFNPTFISYVAPEYILFGTNPVAYCRIKVNSFIKCQFRHRRLNANLVVSSARMICASVPNNATDIPINDTDTYSDINGKVLTYNSINDYLGKTFNNIITF